MLDGLRQTRPGLLAILMAASVALLATGLIRLDFFPDGEGDYAFRIVLIAAHVLMMFDTLETARLRLSLERSRRAQAQFGFYMGYHWAVLLILLGWPGLEGAAFHVLIWGGAGVIFGAFMAWNPGTAAPIPNRYDIERSMGHAPMGRVFTFWPLIMMGVIAAQMGAFAFGLWPLHERYFLWLLVILGTAPMAYEFERSRFWVHFMPRALGLILLTVGIIWL